jgi:integrase
VIPIGPRLRAELVMRRDGPNGEPLPLTARVFGNEVGEPIESIRESWERTCAAASISGLHFHDLRREFACRLLESSADLHDVRDFLGHANITTTSTYLRSTPVRLARALDRLDPEPPKPQQSSDSPDSHTIRTNSAVRENGQPERPAVTH